MVSHHGASASDGFQPAGTATSSRRWPEIHTPWPAEVVAAARDHPYLLLFATISGAHLYGFASADSDWDLRGVHVLPASEVLGIEKGEETIERSARGAVELDLVTHDAAKFFRLLLHRNGYVLEQLYSPLVVRTSPEHAELRAIARGCITRHHAHHYLGFAENQWRLFTRESPPRIKPLLYVFRVLQTGIHLMETGEVEANLPRLNERFRLGFIDELIERKVSGAEWEAIDESEIGAFEAEVDRLKKNLETARDTSRLPDAPRGREELHQLLLRLRGV